MSHGFPALLLALAPDSALTVVAAVVIPFLFKLVGAVALWIVGGWLIQFALRVLRRSLSRGALDVTLINYLINILGALLRVVLAVAILGFFGIQTASFAALLAGAGVAIGAAWSGLLGNFAAGAFLQILRPINVGDYIQAGGVEGTVEEVGMFVTAITSPDNVRHYIGNTKIFGDNIQNYSAHPYRRVDLAAQLDNSADVAQAIALLRKGLETVPHQAPGTTPDVEVLEFTERGPKLAVRPYTHTSHYWEVYFATNRMIVDVLSGAGFPVPRIPLAVQQAVASAN